MSVIRVHKSNDYTHIANAPANDSGLSFKAKGIMYYLLTKPDNWEIKVKDLINRSTDGRDSIYAGINELIEAGYITRTVRLPVDGGGVNYDLYESPNLEDLPASGFSVNGAPASGFSVNGKPVSIDNTDVLDITDIRDNTELENKGAREENEQAELIRLNISPWFQSETYNAMQCVAEIRQTYPRSVNKQGDERAIVNAIARKKKETNWPVNICAAFIYRKTKEYAEMCKHITKNDSLYSLIPHCTTFFNQDRFNNPMAAPRAQTVKEAAEQKPQSKRTWSF